MSYLIKLEDVTIGYESKGILGPLGFSVERDQFWGIMGPNGGGKSTLLMTLLGLLPPVKGDIERRDGIIFGYVPQNEKFDAIFPVTVYEIVSMGRYCRVAPGKKLSEADKEAVSMSLEKIGILHLQERTYRSLSGGEKQRTLLARAIAGGPDILVLDEPTASIDIKGEAQIMELVEQIKRETGLTVLMVSHFLDTVAKYADRIILIDKDMNLFQAGEKTDLLKSEKISEFFGLNLGPGNIER